MLEGIQVVVSVAGRLTLYSLQVFGYVEVWVTLVLLPGVSVEVVAVLVILSSLLKASLIFVLDVVQVTVFLDFSEILHPMGTNIGIFLI